MLWVAWPKKASKVETDLTEDVVRRIGLAAGLVDVKVCAVTEHLVRTQVRPAIEGPLSRLGPYVPVRAVLVWLLLLVLAILNGAFREAVLNPRWDR
jgi:hypothetical protein